MHISPVVIVSHRPGPPGWEAALEELGAALERHPHLPLTLRLPGAAIEHLARSRRSLWEALLDRGILWLAGGFSDPVMADLPPQARRLQLARERAAMDATGINPGALWIRGGWEPGLVTFAAESGHRLLLVDAASLAEVPPAPAAVEHGGETGVLVPVAAAGDDADEDGLAAVMVDPARLAELAVREAGRLILPDAYMATHPPRLRLSPWVSASHRDPDVEPFYRKLLLLTHEQGDRNTGQDALLTLQSQEYAAGSGGGIAAHRRLIEARAALDRIQHRGDSWVALTEADWDADGHDEVVIDTAQATLIVDPAEGTIDVWDDKALTWPITAVQPATLGSIAQRLEADGVSRPVTLLGVERWTQGRGEAGVVLEGVAGGPISLELAGSALTVTLEWGGDEGLIGPELPVALGPARLRADGGEWIDCDEPVAAAGHRFRLTDGDRTLLVSSPRPCDVFVRPVAGRGLLVWPHWKIGRPATHQVTFTPS